MKINYFLLLGTFISLNLSSEASALTLSSSAFTNNGFIPSKYTCDGGNSAPQLSWKDAPPNTKSFVLLVDDPDAPQGKWTHWVLFNIPSDIKQLSGQMNLPKDIISGQNSWGETNYRGPCPPSGTHHYSFRLYALDINLSLDKGVTQKDVLASMQNHILEQSELIGLYRSIRRPSTFRL